MVIFRYFSGSDGTETEQGTGHCGGDLLLVVSSGRCK
jgi:hypothetical protein